MRFAINPDSIKNRITELDSIEGELNSIALGLTDVINVRTVQTESYVQVQRALKNYQQNVRTVSRQTASMRSGLGGVLKEYKSHEQTIYEHATHTKGEFGGGRGMRPVFNGLWSLLFPSLVLGLPGVRPGIGEIGVGAFWKGSVDGGYNDGSDKKISWSFLGGAGSSHTETGGMDVGYDGKYHVGHFQAKGTSSASWDIEKGDVKAGVKGNASFSLVDGEVSGNIGYAKGTLGGSVGNVGAEGSVGLSLFSGGQFAPAIYGSAKAEANVAEGKVSGQLGTDEYNVHVAAEGTLLGAEAEAKFQAGRIVKEDGTVKYGVEGKVGAEAYVAKGSIKGGFTLFGVKIDASVEGKAGGAGAKAGGEVTNSTAEGELGLGLGLGLGVKVKIDWTNFKWPW